VALSNSVVSPLFHCKELGDRKAIGKKIDAPRVCFVKVVWAGPDGSRHDVDFAAGHLNVLVCNKMLAQKKPPQWKGSGLKRPTVHPRLLVVRGRCEPANPKCEPRIFVCR
jgi:hypothetical protein